MEVNPSFLVPWLRNKVTSQEAETSPDLDPHQIPLQVKQQFTCIMNMLKVIERS